MTFHPQRVPPKHHSGKFMWDSDSKLLFKQALRSPYITDLIKNYMSKNFHPEYTPVYLCCDEINNIILGVGRLCLVRKRRPRFQKSKPDKLGFDQECRSLKNQVMRLGRLVNKFPKDPQLYGSFIY